MRVKLKNKQEESKLYRVREGKRKWKGDSSAGYLSTAGPSLGALVCVVDVHTPSSVLKCENAHTDTETQNTTRVGC